MEKWTGETVDTALSKFSASYHPYTSQAHTPAVTKASVPLFLALSHVAEAVHALYGFYADTDVLQAIRTRFLDGYLRTVKSMVSAQEDGKQDAALQGMFDVLVLSSMLKLSRRTPSIQAVLQELEALVDPIDMETARPDLTASAEAYHAQCTRCFGALTCA